jgi:hypothetical protein
MRCGEDSPVSFLYSLDLLTEVLAPLAANDAKVR